MNLNRLGSMHQTRISFARTFVRLMLKHNWQITKHSWDTNVEGYGTIIYKLTTPNNIYHLVIFSNEIVSEERSDRVTSNKWDVTCAFVEGEIDGGIVENLSQNVPFQENGRYTNKVLVLSRANKSVRVFEHIISSLSEGKQPNIKILSEVGYILRTTAVYANGKFGMQDFDNLTKNNKDFKLSFCAQMCAVYMLREFSFDLIRFLSRKRGKDKTVSLQKKYKRLLGVGNATGLGMTLFLAYHPRIIAKWLTVRETALSSCIKQAVTQECKQQIIELMTRAKLYFNQVYTIDKKQKILNKKASLETAQIIETIEKKSSTNLSWHKLIIGNTKYSYETQEAFISCLFELYPQIVDGYEQDMNASEDTKSIVGVNIEQLIKTIENRYQWALSVDFSKKNSHYWFWYISQNKLEPRLGVRGKDAGHEKELNIDIARQVSILYEKLKKYKKLQKNTSDNYLSTFLIQYPEFASIVRRVWTLGNNKMGEIQSNIIDKNFHPMHLLRCKLSIFGATRFDPRSDRWVRVVFFQNAPLLGEKDHNEWLFPVYNQNNEQ